MKFKAKDRAVDLKKPVLMGVLNVTPDSFSDGGNYFSKDTAIAHAKEMIHQGAAIIDVGGESSRPGSIPISAEEELTRVLSVVKALAKTDAVISVDTYKPQVADAVLDAGAHIINDIYGLTNPELREIISNHQAAAILMHMQGNPKTMQQNPQYKDVVQDVKNFLKRQLELAKKQGIQNVAIDPGIGFGKTMQHNRVLLNQLDEFAALGYPLVVGVSRKRFIGEITGDSVENRLAGTLAAVTACVLKGANILRVHDVAQCSKAVDVAWAIKEG